MATREVKTGNAETLESIIVHMYNAVLEPNALFPALARFDAWLGSQVCHLLGWNRLNDRPQFSFMSRPEFLAAGDAYATHFAALDPRRALVGGLQEGTVVQCADYFDSRYVDRSEFYQDLLIRNNVRYSAGGCAFRDDTTDVLLVFNHCIGQPTFSQTQIQAVKRFFPHLQQTFSLINRTESLRAGLFAGEAALASMGHAVMVLGPQNDLRFCTAAAETVLKETNANRLSSAGLFGASFFSEPIRSVLQRVRHSRFTESVLVNAAQKKTCWTIMPLPQNFWPYEDLAAQLHGTVKWGIAANAPTRMPSFGNADLIILVSQLDRGVAISAGQLAQMFRLSPAEGRLAHNLAKGSSLEEHTKVAGVSITTARNQLRAVLEKTGFRRQQDLVRSLSMLANLP